MNYVSYVHAKPDTTDASGIFYVGKGSGKRARKIVRNESSNRHYKHTVSKHGAENILVGVIPCSSEQIAFDLERGLIKCLRRMGVKLTNLTDGGEGSSGCVASPETIKKISFGVKERWRDSDYRDKLSEIQKVVQKGLTSVAKHTSSIKNAEKARHVLATEKKEQSALKNSEKALAMWNRPGFKEQMKQKHAARWTQELRNSKGDDTRGRVRVTNGVEERNVLPEAVDSLISAGWRRGRKPRKSSKRTEII